MNHHDGDPDRGTPVSPSMPWRVANGVDLRWPAADASGEARGNMPRQTKTIEMSNVAELQESLRGAPARPHTKVVYAKAIELVASDIHALRSKGYEWEDITAMLSDKGLQMSVATLRTYLKRVGGDRPGEPAHRKGSRRHRARVDFPGDTTSGHRDSSETRRADASVLSPVTSPLPSKPASPSATKPASASSPATTPRTGDDVPSWSFSVRPDTPDL
jgi:hypothetical protein